MDKCNNCFGNGKLFSILDANSRNRQYEMDGKDVHTMAFVAYKGFYKYTRVPFVLCNAQATLQRAMNVNIATVK